MTRRRDSQAGKRCGNCRRVHESWQQVAEWTYPRAREVLGHVDGPECWATITYCFPDGLRVTLWATEPEACWMLRRLDAKGCGRKCQRLHQFFPLHMQSGGVGNH